MDEYVRSHTPISIACLRQKVDKAGRGEIVSSSHHGQGKQIHRKEKRDRQMTVENFALRPGYGA